MTTEASNLSVAALISGGGTNLQALIDAAGDGSLPANIVLVLSNNSDAGGLQRARDADIPTAIVSHNDYADRESFDDAVREALDRFDPDLIVLAGFMRILSETFVRHYEGRILNIHPSLLPDYTGLNTHQRVIDAGESWHGCTVHFVTAALDTGAPIIQGRVPVLAEDTAEVLAARVLEVEHRIYPIAVAMFAAGRLQYRDGRSWLDGAALLEPVRHHGSRIRL